MSFGIAMMRHFTGLHNMFWLQKSSSSTWLHSSMPGTFTCPRVHILIMEAYKHPQIKWNILMKLGYAYNNLLFINCGGTNTLLVACFPLSQPSSPKPSVTVSNKMFCKFIIQLSLLWLPSLASDYQCHSAGNELQTVHSLLLYLPLTTSEAAASSPEMVDSKKTRQDILAGNSMRISSLMLLPALPEVGGVWNSLQMASLTLFPFPSQLKSRKR